MDSHTKELADRILTRINEIRVFRRRVRMASFAAFGIVALGAMIPAWRELTSEASSTGFWQYTSMFIHDPSFVATAWKDFAILLAESLPAFGIAALGTSVLAFGASVRSFSRIAVTA